jgi:hypothetical protein
MSKVFVSADTLTGTCGVGVLYDFCSYARWSNLAADDVVPPGGAGYVVVGYIKNEICDTVYETLKKRWKIVFESEERVNRNSGNLFYFCVYDVTETEDKYGFDDAERQ